MSHKPLFAVCMIVIFFLYCTVEGGALSAGQAIIPLAAAVFLGIWNFIQTDWYEPAEKESALRSGNFNKGT